MECMLNESDRFYGPSDLREHLYQAFSATTFGGDMKHSVVCRKHQISPGSSLLVEGGNQM